MDVGVVDRLMETSRRIAREQADELSLIYELSCAATHPEFAAVEVACALTLTRFAAENVVQLAAQLCDRLPEVHRSLSNGDISRSKAQVFAEVLDVLEVDTARAVAAAVLPKAPSRTTGQLREMLRRKALAADPNFTAARRKQSSSQRRVQLHADDEGTASLMVFGLDAARSAAAMQRIGQLALSRKLEGDSATFDQLRADVLLELLEGQHSGAARGVINLSVSLETLARFNDDPASLGSYGPIAADIARQWTETHPGYQWQFAVNSPSGELLQQGLTRAGAGITTRQKRATAKTKAARAETAAAKPPAHQPFGPANAGSVSHSLARPPVQDPHDRAASAAMTRWIRLRDRTCRAPGCRMPAWQSDIDHNQRHTNGGATAHDNLCALCRHHHRAKDEGGWVLVQTRPGHFIWTSPLGRIYEIGPDPP